jgi:hypothetical protein
MRTETLAANIKIEAIRKAMAELSASSTALRDGRIDDAEVRKQLESIRKALEDLNVR